MNILRIFHRPRTIAELRPELRKWAYVGLHVLKTTRVTGR